jgi:signal transduction histidine kinase
MSKIHVLNVEDNATDAFFIQQVLEDSGLDADICLAATSEEYIAELEHGPVDLILADSGLAGFSGAAALKIAREKCPNVPVIFVSCSADPRDVAEAMNAGAADYIPKGELARLADAVRRATSGAAIESEQARLKVHNRAMMRLVAAVQELSLAHSLDAIMAIVRTAARELTGADGATFVLRDGDQCHYADEDAIEPLWKGQRFPLSACISGWAMLNKKPAIIEDIYADARIPAAAYRPTFVKSLVMVPIRTEAPIGAIGNYWAARHLATPEEVELLQALANTTAVAMESVHVYEELEQRVRSRTLQLEAANRELETFSYSASHDLQAPLRRIDGFTQLLLKNCRQKLETKPAQYFDCILSETKRMMELVNDLLRLARFARAELHYEKIDLSAIARELLLRLQASDPSRKVDLQIEEDIEAYGDPGLLRVVLENLFSNAWKYGAKREVLKIEFGAMDREDGTRGFFIRDNGAGFDTRLAGKLFAPFQRLHSDEEFAGTGVGLATVQRIIHRHAGLIWAEAEVDKGATFTFTLPDYLPQGAVAA